MIDTTTIKRGLTLMNREERRRAVGVSFVLLVAAFAAAAMIGSILPFFSALTDPDYIHSQKTLAWLFDTLGFQSDFSFLIFLGVFSIAIILLGNLLQLLRVIVTVNFTQMQMHHIGVRLLSRYLSQPYVKFLNLNASTASSHVLAGSMQAVNRFFFPLVDLFASVVTALAIIALLLWIDPAISLASLTLIGGTYVLMLYLLRDRLATLGDEVVEANKQRFRTANEALTGIKDIKTLGREASYLGFYEDQSLRFSRGQAEVAVLSGFPQFFIQIIAFGGIILLCLILVRPETSGANASSFFPLLGVYAFAVQKLVPELQKIYGALATLRSSTAIISQLSDEFSSAPKLAFVDPNGPRTGLKKNLRLENVGFSYPGTERPGLVNVSFAIEAGMSLGIVGRSGAGKTTLADILLGLLQPTEGQLVIDDTPLTDEARHDWQRTLGYVPQYIFLSDTSIGANIALGVPDAQRDASRIRSSAAAAQLHEFIESLPEGYETRVGDRGVKLSGGQRQRIGVARALYHDRDVMVFDEATSALDTATERDLMSAISGLAGQKTVIVIAHRLSTVRNCDRIAVLDGGRLVGFGAWEELERDNQTFRKIARAATEDGGSRQVAR